MRSAMGLVWTATAALVLGGDAAAQLVPDWLTVYTPPQGFNAGMASFLVDLEGNTYMVGRTGSSSNQDALITKVSTAGTVLWVKTYNGPANWHDTAAGVALSPVDGTIVVAGNTPGPGSYSDGLLLKLNAQTGDLVWDRAFDGGPYTSDSLGSVAVDAQGNIYAVGGTVGDGADGLIVKYSAAGDLIWHRVFDGPSLAPYSQDNYTRVMLEPSGDPIAVGKSNMADQQDDWVITRYAATTGDVVWQTFHGGFGHEQPSDMTIDVAGDVYVTGLDFDAGVRRTGTAKLRNSDGEVIWSQLDTAGARNQGVAITLAPGGHVCIAARADPDGDVSNNNENIHVIGRDAATGTAVWSFLYGANCVGCFDVPNDLIADSAGNLFIAGQTNSAPYSNDGILFVLNAGTGSEVDRAVFERPMPFGVTARTTMLDAAQNLYVAGNYSDLNTGGVEIFEARFESSAGGQPCYANCDQSTAAPVLNVADFGCFLQKFVAGDSYANCDGSTEPPVLNVVDFGCFLQRFASGCP